MISESVIRDHLLELLRGGHAHMSFDDAVANFPTLSMNALIPQGTYSPWHLLEHLRLTQQDILEFLTNPEYRDRAWPEDYWPPRDATATPAQWQETIDGFHTDMAILQSMVQDPTLDLDAPIPHGTGQTPLREFLLVADHNAYHIGEFAILRQVMGTWPPNHR
jgi:hypothetical protein